MNIATLTYKSKTVPPTRMFLLLLMLPSVFSFDHHDCSQIHGNQHRMCQYMKNFKKIYQHRDEFVSKNKIVMERVSHQKLSSKDVSYGLTIVSDKTFIKNNKLAETAPFNDVHIKRLKSYHLPARLDLRSKMQPAKDQGNCGSCYIFAGVAVLEYHAGMALSEQKIMDCTSSTSGPSYGCDGGWPTTIFEYAKHSPVVGEQDQPYQEKNLACNQTCGKSKTSVIRYGTLDKEKDPHSESRIPYILNTYGPVTVAIDVGTTELLSSYENGTFPGIACGKKLDHAVVIVGYTEDVWIVRNSWSINWGDSGYFYLERGVNACGVAESIGYVSKDT